MLPPFPIPPEVLDLVLALVTPEQNEKDLKVVAQEQAHQLNDGLVMKVKEGYLPIWSREKDARTRFQGYLFTTNPETGERYPVTFIEDLPRVLDPKLKHKRVMGDPEALMPLKCEQMLAMREQLLGEQEKANAQRQQAVMMGADPQMIAPALPLPPELENLQIFWPLVLQVACVSDEVGAYELVSRDFAALFRRYALEELGFEPAFMLPRTVVPQPDYSRIMPIGMVA